MKSPEVNDTRIQKATPEMDDDTRRALTMWKMGLGNSAKRLNGEDPIPQKRETATKDSWKTLPMPGSIGRTFWNSAVLTDFAAIDFETANEQPSSVCSVGVAVLRSRTACICRPEALTRTN